jgi:hypothetical protein
LSLFAAWVVYPLVLLALCSGMGLLVDALAGRRLPGALVPPVGLAAIVVVGQFTTWSDATAELSVPLVCFLAALGPGFALPWRFARPDPWAAGAALAVFAVFAAPVVLSGEPTFAGYIKLDDTATWLALTDRVMEHGHSLAGLEPSTYRATLEFNLAGGYPVGAFLPFGVAQKLTGGDLAWVFQPYLTFLAAMLSLCLWQVAGAVLERPPARAFVAFIAAQPALLFGYALWGGVKEMAAAALVALAAALAPAAVRAGGRPRDTLPLALAAAALVGVLSPGGLVWLGPMLLALAYLALRRFDLRGALARIGFFAAALVAMSVPALATGLVPPTSKPLVGSNGEGNLRGPLEPLQALGIWPSGDFRFHPDASVGTAILVALGLLAALLGLRAAWRHRAAAPLLLASALIAAGAIVVLGSPWAAGKALATVSPAALALAALGALAALRLDRPSGVALLAVVAGGVLWSNVLAYGGVDLAPYGQLRELEQIGKEFAGQGPTLMTEYNPYGARHFLREEDGEGASELRVREVPLREGGTVTKGYGVDTDELALSGLLEFRTLVLRRSPVRSRPPSPYRLVRAGKYYEVWQRPVERFGAIPEHQPYGGESDPAAVPSCSEINGVGLLALQNHLPNARLLAARHAPIYDATDGNLTVPRAGVYEAWLKGSARGAISLYVDGRKIGEVRQQLENEGGWLQLGVSQLIAGHHEAELRFGGADLHPGSGGFPRPETGPLLFTPAGPEVGHLVTVPIAEASRLCGPPWDWIEAIGR